MKYCIRYMNRSWSQNGQQTKPGFRENFELVYEGLSVNYDGHNVLEIKYNDT